MAAPDWADYFGGHFNSNTRLNFKSGYHNEGGIYSTNDVIEVPATIQANYSFHDNQTIDYSNFTSDDYCTSNNSHAYLNVTCEFPINYAEPMYG